ncbi:hypothetical protein [Nibricoccus sp. IMCC34717]|uniref:hypothetical protein n=1 Tax=Nibricoccus sp. IMCC34717 TaxID=3034021 RepID=UPI00384F5296
MELLHSIAVTHPLMTIAFAMFVAFYFTGVYLVLSSLAHQSEFVVEDNGDFRALPESSEI